MSKWELNKEKKEQALFNTAYDLFIHNGFNNTTINEIVKKAGVAKGTFYLYFKDKFDLRDKIIMKKTYDLFAEAVEQDTLKGVTSFTPRLLITIDYIIDYLKENIALLRFINKNLIYGIYKKAFSQNIFDEGKKTLYDLFLEGIITGKYQIEHPEIIFCLIIELVSAICYSSIILSEPAPIEEMKPYLHKSIQGILDAYQIKD